MENGQLRENRSMDLFKFGSEIQGLTNYLYCTLLILYNQDDNRVLHVALLGRARYCPLAMKRAAGWQGYGHAELSTQKNQAVVYVPGRTHHTVYLNYTYYINILEDAYGCRV